MRLEIKGVPAVAVKGHEVNVAGKGSEEDMAAEKETRLKMADKHMEFRAWDIQRKGYINGVNMIGFSTGQGGPVRKLQRYNTEWDMENIILEQWSGFRGRYRAKIFAGSIIKFTEESCGVGEEISSENAAVIFDSKEGCFTIDRCLQLRNLGGHYLPLLLSMGYGEVIGDIHNNPELLKNGN